MNGRKLRLKRSTLKHGISVEDIQYAVNNYRYNNIMEKKRGEMAVVRV